MFPKELTDIVIKSDEDLINLFKKYPHFCDTYLRIATDWKEYREWYEMNWPRVRKFLDKNFLEKFPTKEEYYSRAWEFFLAVTLVDNDIELIEKNWETGPDFCFIIRDGKKVWIEAISCSRGDVDAVDAPPNLKPGIIYTFGGNIEDSHRPRALRITQAIASKFEKYKKYIRNGKLNISQNDILCIAVDGTLINHYARPEMLFKRAVFGQGPEVLIKVPGQDDLKRGFYKPEPIIIKIKDGIKQEIPSNFMELEEFSNISAVIYSGNDYLHSLTNEYKAKDTFLFAYHSMAKNPIPQNVFKFGREIRKNSFDGSIQDLPQ